MSVIFIIWDEDKIPQDQMERFVCPIYKKGDKVDCSNYRGTTFINAVYKVLSQILFRRLSLLVKQFVGQR